MLNEFSDFADRLSRFRQPISDEDRPDVHHIFPYAQVNFHAIRFGALGQPRRIVQQDLGAAGVKPQRAAALRRSDKLTGKTIVVTGELENFTRQQVEQEIKQAGGNASSSVSKKTDFVLAGKNAGSKLDKALKLGVKVISEQEFLMMLKS